MVDVVLYLFGFVMVVFYCGSVLFFFFVIVEICLVVCIVFVDFFEGLIVIVGFFGGVDFLVFVVVVVFEVL